MRLSPGTQLGRYVVESLLGAGGMGEVYLAEDRVLARRVALKLLHGDRQDDDLLRRFEQEALAASALNHPHILTIYEFGTEGDVRFLACEYVEGTSVRERLREARGPLPIPEIVHIGLQTATALAAAHRAGIVHRDVKPENLMVRPDGYVKVLDFGLAKRTVDLGPLADAHTVATSMPGVILGTVVYMAPEQARGMPVDARADIWSLGCVLYEMTTGRRPFDGESPLDVLAAVLDRQPAAIAGPRPDCPPALISLIDRMLLKDREARIQSMSAVADELKNVARELDAPRQPKGSLAAGEREAPRAPFRWRPVGLLAGLVLAFALIAGIVLRNRSDTLPEARDVPAVGSSVKGPGVPEAPVAGRTLEFWLTVERLEDDDSGTEPPTFVTPGGGTFHDVSRFRLNVNAPDGGYLYVLNEGPDKGGRTTLVLLHPGAKAASAAMTDSRMELPWYRFTPHAGTEQLWLVSATAPVPELDAIIPLVNPADKGLVSRPDRVDAVKRLLASHQAPAGNVATDFARTRTIVRGRGPILAHLLKLEHN
jgi:tRNA A-37 threonylcarbamoyl transferase component Bud32